MSGESRADNGAEAAARAASAARERAADEESGQISSDDPAQTRPEIPPQAPLAAKDAGDSRLAGPAASGPRRRSGRRQRRDDARLALPRAYPDAPACALWANAGAPSVDERYEAVRLIRAERLWWPAPRAAATAPRRLLVDPGGPRVEVEARLAFARELGVGFDGFAAAPRRSRAWLDHLARRFDLSTAPNLSAFDVAMLELLAVRKSAPPAAWLCWSQARLLDLDAPARPPEPATPPPNGVQFVDPWRGGPVGWLEGARNAAFFAAHARERARPIVTVGLSPWKRKNVRPFLSGPHGPPKHARTAAAARRLARRSGAEIAVWGARRRMADELSAAGYDVLRIEDGFIRSVGLGVEHERPISLVAARRALHFETDRATDLGDLLRAGPTPEAGRARAAAFADRLRRLEITKYMDDAPPDDAAPPETDRRRVLVVGQVAGDAALRFGAGLPEGNLDLIRRVRARWPDAFLAYKPHPDVVSGLRSEPHAEAIAALADVELPRTPPIPALEWADQVETMTSQLGFEALIRGRPVACHGRPFYAGLGLTADLAAPDAASDPAPSAPAPRGEGAGAAPAATVEDLIHAALIAYPRYVATDTRLPCPPEVAVERVVAMRAQPRSRFEKAWKRAIARLLSHLP